MLKTVEVHPEDEDFLYELYASTRLEEISSWGWSQNEQESFLQMQYQLQQRTYEANYSNTDHRVVYIDFTPVGRIFLSRCEDEIILIDISILPHFRNQNIGTYLIQELQEEAATKGMYIKLHVLQTNRAIQLYTRLGFALTDNHGIYSAMKWHSS